MLGKRGNIGARGIVATGIAFGATIILDASLATAQGWQFVEPMPTARSYHGAATVGNRWYVAGGAAFFGTGNGERFPTEVDVYEPTAGHWTALGNLAEGREYVRAVADPVHARVLFSGGFLPAGPNAYLALPDCDLVALDVVSPAPELLGARHLHAIAFAAGRLVVSGGWGMQGPSSSLLDDAEVWDGTASGWVRAGTMPAGPRSGHSMTTLMNGNDVLVAGGCRPDGSTADVAVFDAACSAWKPVASLHTSRCSHTAALLGDGRVLVVGGGNTMKDTGESSVEIFDPTTNQWTSGASMRDGRYDHDAVVLPDGRVLVAGGTNSQRDGEFGALSSVEVYDPAVDAWASLPPMHDRRRKPALAVLSDGVYVAGGSYSETTTPSGAIVLASVERLAWSDLGITGPIDLDAGATGGAASDASTVCGSDDAGTNRDAAPDADAHTDAAMDGSSPHDAATDASIRDAATSDGGSVEAPKGCSCALGTTIDESLLGFAVAGLALCALLTRRSRKPQGALRNSRHRAGDEAPFQPE